MHLVYGSVFRIEFSYTDRVRYNSARIVSFSKFSIFRKFVFVFVFGLSAFVFVFVFKCKSRKRSRSSPFDSVRFHPYPFCIPRSTNAAQPQVQQQSGDRTVGYSCFRIVKHSNPIAEGTRRVATASCGGPMDQSYHGGAAAGGSADFNGQMWVRGTRVVCVRHSVSFGACLVLRLLLIRDSRGAWSGIGV